MAWSFISTIRSTITSLHIHVYYGDFEASVGIDGELMAGSLPRKQLVFIQAWLALHEEEAYAAWNKAVQGEHFEKIAPLA